MDLHLVVWVIAVTILVMCVDVDGDVGWRWGSDGFVVGL